MEQKIKIVTCVSLFLFAVFLMTHMYTENEVLLSLTITFGTITYHFGMRSGVGLVFDKIMKKLALKEKMNSNYKNG